MTSSHLNAKRVPEAYRLVKSLSEAEARFHKQFRSILRKRSERSDRLFDLFRGARNYRPQLVAEVLGNTYTPHNAAMLMKLLKRQVLASLSIYMENQDAVLKELAEEAVRRVETIRLGKEAPPHGAKKKDNQSAPNVPSDTPDDTTTPSLVQAAENIFQEEEKKIKNTSAEERKKRKKLEKWLELIQKEKPEKALKKWKDMLKAGLADATNEKLLTEALERRVKALAENGKTANAVELIYAADKKGFRIDGAREIVRTWLSENLPS